MLKPRFHPKGSDLMGLGRLQALAFDSEAPQVM